MNLIPPLTLVLLVLPALLPFSATAAPSDTVAGPANPVVPQKATPFTAAQVRLLDGVFRESQDAEADYLLSLDLDRLVAPYRVAAELPAKAPAYPGWETENLPGVALAFYLSGLSRLYATTGKAEYGTRIQYLLDELEACQKRCDGYLLGTTGGRATLARVEREGWFDGFSVWHTDGRATPYYSMEKLFSGLRDAWRLGRHRQALQIAVALANWLEGHMSHLSDQQLQALMRIEFGGLNWVLADLYADTGDTRYLAMSKRWQHRWLTDELAQGRDNLARKHANAQFPKISGLAARYPYSGDPADLDTARFFWESVARHHSYATGGNSESEFFDLPDQLGDRLTPFTEENCNVYNMLRLTSLLAAVEPRAEYADYMERALFNHILAAQHRDSGAICYFLPLLPGATKTAEPLHTLFSCCVCSAMDSYVRHGEYIYSHGQDDLYVNLFIASEVEWADQGVSLRQETRFPEQETTTLQLSCRQPTDFALHLRYPAWAARGLEIRINGVEEKFAARAGEFVRIARTWRDGDRVDVRIPFSLRAEPLPGGGSRVALFYGPVLLAGEIPSAAGWSDPAREATPVLVPEATPVEQWLVPGAEPLLFNTAVARPGQVSVKPFYRIKTGGYTVYWDVLTPTAWAELAAAREDHAQELRDRESRTADLVVVGDAQSESGHALSGDSVLRQGHGCLLPGRGSRRGLPGKSFAYQLKVPASEAAVLVCTFVGREPYPLVDRLFYRISVAGTEVLHEQLQADRNFTTGLYEKRIPISRELIAGKSAVEVRFTADPGGKTASLVELRMVARE